VYLFGLLYSGRMPWRNQTLVVSSTLLGQTMQPRSLAPVVTDKSYLATSSNGEYLLPFPVADYIFIDSVTCFFSAILAAFRCKLTKVVKDSFP